MSMTSARPRPLARTAIGMLAWLAPLLVIAALVRPSLGGQDSSHQERWAVLLLDGKRAGHAVEREERTPESHLSTSARMQFKIQRMGVSIDLGVSTRFVETEEGRLVLMESEQNMGPTGVVERYRFEQGGVIHETDAGGRKTQERLPLPAAENGSPILTPRQASEFVRARLAAGDKEFSYSTLDPTVGLKPVIISHRVRGPAKIEVMGKTVPAVEWAVTQNIMPGVTSIEFVDHEGEPLKTDINLGGITITVLASEKEVALSEFSAPELMARTLVTPDKPIGRARSSRTGAYILSGAEPDRLASIPSCAAQRAKMNAAGGLRVSVELDQPQPAGPDAQDPRFTAPSAMLDTRDPAIVEIAKTALKGVSATASQSEKAEVLRRFVHSYIDRKSLGVGFATASQVCATREGDCSEHGVLLAALLRASGIPSRVVSGLVYVDEFGEQQGVFGFHMWTQALLADGGGVRRWIDLDATLDSARPFDATHISLSTSSLAQDDVINSMAALAGLIGNLKIAIERVE